MKIFLIISLAVIFIILLFIFTNTRVFISVDNSRELIYLKIKIYAFSLIPVLWLKREFKNEGKKSSLKDKISEGIEFLVKNKADPVEYTGKKIRKSTKLPDIVKNFDYKKIFIDKLNLKLCLDFDNAAVSAITTGALNAIFSMVISKYADNIIGPVNYDIFPGYTGNGIKFDVTAKIKVRAFELIKAFVRK